MKSFISKKKAKTIEKVLQKEEIIIPNINIAELDKKFALLEMNNSFLKKIKNSNTSEVDPHQSLDSDISIPKPTNFVAGESQLCCSESHRGTPSGERDVRTPVSKDNLKRIDAKQTKEDDNDEIEFEIEFEDDPTSPELISVDNVVKNEDISKKPILKLSNKTKSSGLPIMNLKEIKPKENSSQPDEAEKNINKKIINTRSGSRAPAPELTSDTGLINLRDFAEKLPTAKKIEDIIPSFSDLSSIEVTRNKKSIRKSDSVLSVPASVNLKQSGYSLGGKSTKFGDEFNLKNVVSKLEIIGVSEHKSFNYNTIIKNESINCNSYNCMYDTSNNSSTSLLNLNKTNINCWWCRYSIPENLLLLGCPIKYHKANQSLGKDEHFETEGFFCSFNCVLSYNNDVSQHNIRYRETGGLIYLLYKKLFGFYPYQMNIKPAPSWKILKAYGGDMTIQEFRNTFQKVESLSENAIKNKELFLPSSVMFIEEKSNIKLNQSEF